jgi:hypothetical protein
MVKILTPLSIILLFLPHVSIVQAQELRGMLENNDQPFLPSSFNNQQVENNVVYPPTFDRKKTQLHVSSVAQTFKTAGATTTNTQQIAVRQSKPIRVAHKFQTAGAPPSDDAPPATHPPPPAAEIEARKTDCDKCKANPPDGIDWQKSCAAPCSAASSDIDDKGILNKIKASFLGKGGDKCPEFEFSWDCLEAYSPDQTFVSLGISSTVKGGSIQLVWDLETFEVGMYAGGGISVGTNCVSAVDVSVEVGICYKGENSGRELDSGGYGGFGLSVDVGVDVGVAGVSAIFGVDASIATKEDSDKLDITTLAPNWNAGKALAVGVGVGIAVPTLFSANIGADYMARIWSVKCADYFYKLAPYCEAVVLFMTPPVVPLLVKVSVMRSFMKKWCPEQEDSSLCTEVDSINSGKSRLLLLQVKEETKHGIQLSQRVRDPDDVWGEIVTLWASLGTEMMEAFQAALKMGHLAVELVAKAKAEFENMAKSAKNAANQWLAENVGERLTELRAHFGDVRPEDQPDIHHPIPSGKGVYIKIKDCGTFGDEDGETLDAPYWDCYPYDKKQKRRRRLLDLESGWFGDDEDEDDLDDDKVKHTEIGEHKGPDKARYYWDWNEDPEKAGWGIFMRKSTQQCIKCLLRNRHTLGWDLSFGNDNDLDDAVSMTVCDGSHEQFEKIKVDGPSKSVKGSTCQVLYKDQRNGK